MRPQPRRDVIKESRGEGGGGQSMWWQSPGGYWMCTNASFYDVDCQRVERVRVQETRQMDGC